MNKIKEILIHWLGGFTTKECEELSIDYALACLRNIKKYADSLYGITTDAWASRVYKKLNEKIVMLEKAS